MGCESASCWAFSGRICRRHGRPEAFNLGDFVPIQCLMFRKNSFLSILSGLACLWASGTALAGQYTLVQGQPSRLPVVAEVRNGLARCNLRISVQGQPEFDRAVQAPDYTTVLDILPQDNTPVTVRWRGQFRRSESGEGLDPCPTAGEAVHAVLDSQAPLRARWDAWFERQTPPMADCLRVGLGLIGVRTESYDLADPQDSVTDRRIRTLERQCESFVAVPKAWGQADDKRHACTLNGARTFCEGLYLQPGAARKAGKPGSATPISKAVALQRHIDGQPFTTAVRENTQVRQARDARLRQEAARREAEEAARIKAEEEARIRQAEAEKSRKLAEEKARQDKEEADRQQAEADKIKAEEERKAKRNFFQRTWEDQVKARLKGASE